MKACGTCKWFNGVTSMECQFPLPFWLLRELHHPLTGGGQMVRVVRPDDGTECPTYESLTGKYF